MKRLHFIFDRGIILITYRLAMEIIPKECAKITSDLRVEYNISVISTKLSEFGHNAHSLNKTPSNANLFKTILF